MSTCLREYLINCVETFCGWALGAVGIFVTPVVDTMSESLVNVTWPDPIQYAFTLQTLCSKYVCVSVVLRYLLTQKDVVTRVE